MNVSGGDHLTDYAFLTKESLHSFCSTCGVSVLVRVLGEGPEDDVCPINVRTIQGVDVERLKLKKYDGKSKDPVYVVPE